MTSGSCMCGAIKWEFTDKPDATVLCHCTDCQKWTGTTYTCNLMIPRSNFSITKGSPKHYVVVGGTGKNNDHFFCGDCGSSLYTMLDSLPDVTVVKSGGLDDPEIRRSLAVGIELYTKDRIGFVNELHGAQQEEAFGDLGK